MDDEKEQFGHLKKTLSILFFIPCCSLWMAVPQLGQFSLITAVKDSWSSLFFSYPQWQQWTRCPPGVMTAELWHSGQTTQVPSSHILTCFS